MLKGAKKTKGAKGVKETMRNGDKRSETVRNSEKRGETKGKAKSRKGQAISR